MIRKASIIFLTILSLMSFIMISCSEKEEEKIQKSQQQEQKVVKIGAILPLTGKLGLYGQNTKEGIDLAVEDINKKGGINGKKLIVVYEDNKASARDAVSSLHKLINNDKIFAIIDDSVSTITLSLVPIATKNKVVILSTGATNPRLSGISPYFFRIWNSDAEEGRFIARKIIDRFNLKNIVVLYVNNDYGKGLLEVFSKEISKLGGKIAGAISYDQNSVDFKNLVAKVKSLNFDAIYLVGYAPQTGRIIKELREFGINKKIFSTVATEDPVLLKIAGKYAEGIIYPFPEPPKGEVVEEFRKKFKSKYGKEPQILCDVGYDAAILYAKALKSGAKNGDDIVKFFRTMEVYNGASGKIKFDENGDVHKPMILKIIKGGKFVEL